MLNTTSVRLYAARWALLSHEETPTSALSHALLVHLPLWLPRFLLGIFCALLCPHLQAEEITDGNVNYSFVVTDRRSGKKLFIKQAEAFLKWQPSMALDRDRMRREVQYFRDVAAALGEQDAARFLPRIYHFDLPNTTFVMEFLTDHTVAFDTLFARGRVSKARLHQPWHHPLHHHPTAPCNAFPMQTSCNCAGGGRRAGRVPGTHARAHAGPRSARGQGARVRVLERCAARHPNGARLHHLLQAERARAAARAGRRGHGRGGAPQGQVPGIRLRRGRPMRALPR